MPTPLHEKHLYRAERHITLDAAQAELDFGEAIRLAPTRSHYVYRRGLFYESLRRLPEAQADLQMALQLVPEEDTRQRARITGTLERINAEVTRLTCSRSQAPG